MHVFNFPSILPRAMRTKTLCDVPSPSRSPGGKYICPYYQWIGHPTGKMYRIGLKHVVHLQECNNV